jgi:hypothetical protein
MEYFGSGTYFFSHTCGCKKYCSICKKKTAADAFSSLSNYCSLKQQQTAAQLLFAAAEHPRWAHDLIGGLTKC